MALTFSLSSPGEVRDKTEEVLSDARYQTELPSEGWEDAAGAAGEYGIGPGGDGASGSEDGTPGASGRSARDYRSRRLRLRARDGSGSKGGRSTDQPEPPSFSLQASSAVGTALMWTLLGILVVLALAWFFRRFREGEGEVEEDVVDADLGEVGPLDIKLPSVDEAEALARQGRYGEAIHLLLLRAIRAMTRVSDVRVARSLTSREILDGVRLPDSCRPPLGNMIRAVEATHFGGQPAGQADYDSFVSSYRRFADELREGAA